MPRKNTAKHAAKVTTVRKVQTVTGRQLAVTRGKGKKKGLKRQGY
jgi:hypothetical protein